MDSPPSKNGLTTNLDSLVSKAAAWAAVSPGNSQASTAISPEDDLLDSVAFALAGAVTDRIMSRLCPEK